MSPLMTSEHDPPRYKSILCLEVLPVHENGFFVLEACLSSYSTTYCRLDAEYDER